MQEKKLESHLARVGKLSEDKLVEIFEQIHYSSGYIIMYNYYLGAYCKQGALAPHACSCLHWGARGGTIMFLDPSHYSSVNLYLQANAP